MRVIAAALFIALAGATDAAARAPFVTGISFVDEQRGVVVINRCVQRSCHDVMFTSDGGRTLRPAGVSGRGWSRVTPVAGGGWLIARGSSVYRGAGTRWEAVRLQGRILAMTARHTGAWAITRPCSHARLCRMRLWHSFDAGRSWWWTTAPRGVHDRGGKEDVEIAFANAADGAAVYPRRGGYTIARTGDGGHSWHTRRAPCGRAFSARLRFSAAPDGSLWLACASGSGTGIEGHQMFVSTDGARSFALRAEAPFLERDRVGRGLGSSGYLTDLAPASAHVAYLTLHRGGLRRTTDGGRTWRRLEQPESGDSTGYVATAVIAGGDRVWQSMLGRGLWTSGDGGRRWTRLPARSRVR